MELLHLTTFIFVSDAHQRVVSNNLGEAFFLFQLFFEYFREETNADFFDHKSQVVK